MRWDEIDDSDPHDFTIFTMPPRFAELGDLHEDIDDHVFDIAPLLEWADRDEAEGKETPTTGAPTSRTTRRSTRVAVGHPDHAVILNADFAELGDEVARIRAPTGSTST